MKATEITLKTETLLFYGNAASEKQVETETETCRGNDLAHFEKQITKGKVPFQEAKTLQNTYICYLIGKPEQLLFKNKNRRTGT